MIKSLPNMITLSRALMAPVFLWCVHDIFVYRCAANTLPLLLFIAIIASDVADGFLARKLGCASPLGAKLDVLSDALYSLLSITLFVYFKVIPFWFPLVMAAKFAEFLITSRLNRRIAGRKAAVVFDPAGKTAACAAMLLPGVFVFRCVILDYALVMNVVVYGVTALFAVSSVNRIAALGGRKNK